MDMFTEKRNAMAKLLEEGFKGESIQRPNEAEFFSLDNMSVCRILATTESYHGMPLFCVKSSVLLSNVGSWLRIISLTSGSLSDVLLLCLSGRKDHEDALSSLAGKLDFVKAEPGLAVDGMDMSGYYFTGLSDRKSKLVAIHYGIVRMDSSLEPFSSSVLGSAQGIIDFYKLYYDKVTKEGATTF